MGTEMATLRKGDGDGEKDGGPNGVVEKRVGEELDVVGERAAGFGAEGENEAVEERVDEGGGHDGGAGKDEQGGGVQATSLEAIERPGHAGKIRARAGSAAR